MILYVVYVLAGLGAGVVTGLAGLSAAVVITPLLTSLCGWASYDAVTVALAADVLASMLTAYTYYKNKNIDLKKASKSVGEKSVELLHVKDINKVTGYIRGGCTPIGMKKQYKTVIHKSAEAFDEIIISGGKNG